MVRLEPGDRVLATRSTSVSTEGERGVVCYVCSAVRGSAVIKWDGGKSVRCPMLANFVRKLNVLELLAEAAADD